MALAALCGPAAAQVAWTGTTSNDWNVGTNWASGAVPVAGTAVNIGTSPNPPVLGIGGAALGFTGNIAVGVIAGVTGNLTIQNGSTLTSSGVSVRLGQGSGTNGTVTVTGPGSQWLVTNGQLVLGFVGSGTLNINDGGKVSALASSGTRVAGGTGSSGTLNISGGSTLETTVLSGLGVGASQVNFDNGILQARANQATFITGFSGTELNILAGGLTIDTGAFTVGTDAASALTGVGGLTKIGTGTLNLAASNTYAGQTVIQAGTLALTGAGDISNSSRVVADGTFDVSGVAAAGTSVQSLAGSGGVALGAKNLAITNANDDFSGVIDGTGGLTLNGGTQTLSGANTYSGATTVDGGTLQLGNGGTSGSVVGTITTAATGTLAFDRSDAFTFDNLVLGDGTIRQIGSGTTTMTADNSAFAGTTSVEAGALAVNGVLGGTMNVLSGGRLQGTGQVGTTTNAGTVAPGNSIGTLTVAGDYTGNGGKLEIESVLGGDASPTDRLVVTGNTAGSTNVRVINLGGTGGQTVEGIKVVQVDGTSAGNFSLLGNYLFHGTQAVIGGAYAYRLYQGGTTSPSDGDWYLRSALIDPGTPQPPNSPPPSTPVGPLYAASVPMYEVYSQVLQGLNDLPTLQQRVGNRYWNGTAHTDSDATATPGIWARIEGRHSEYDGDHSTTGSSFDADEFKLQSGLDGLIVDNAFGRLLAGVNVQYGTSSADVRSFYGDGHINAEGYGFGGTLTWYDRSGFYVDGQARATWFNNDLRSDLVGILQDGNDAFGYAFSLEAGQRVPVNSIWALIPQAQLSYSNVDFDSFTDPFGAQVSSNNGDSLNGRLGLALENRNAWLDTSGATSRSSLYGIANLYYEFLNGAGATVSGTNISTEGERLWGGLGAGGTYSWADEKFSVYGEVLANTSLESFGDSHSYSATGGFRVKW